jgi:putative adhesin
MKRILGTIVLVCLGCVLALGQDGGSNRSVTKFRPDGLVQLRLSAGDWTVKAGAADKIVITLHGRAGEIKRVRMDYDVKDATAKVTVSNTPEHDFRGEIELPARSDLMLRLTAGDLKVKGIEGNKDVEGHAGDVDIEIGDADDYGQVDLSVIAGDISAQPFEQSTGGLFRHLEHTGSGPYSLRVHLDAGDLRVFSGKRETL